MKAFTINLAVALSGLMAFIGLMGTCIAQTPYMFGCSLFVCGIFCSFFWFLTSRKA